MKSAYEKLYEVCSVKESFFDAAHFVAMQGEHYQNNTRKFLLIGRAPNGWESWGKLTKNEFGSKAEEQFKDYSRWSKWIESINGTLYSTHDREKN